MKIFGHNFSENPDAGSTEDRNETKVIGALAIAAIAVVGSVSLVRADIFAADVTVGHNASAAFTCTTMHLEDLTTVEGLAFDTMRYDHPEQRVILDKITGHMYVMPRRDVSVECPEKIEEDEILVINLR